MADKLRTVSSRSRSAGRQYELVPGTDRYVEVVDTILGSEVVANGKRYQPPLPGFERLTDIDVSIVIGGGKPIFDVAAAISGTLAVGQTITVTFGNAPGADMVRWSLRRNGTAVPGQGGDVAVGTQPQYTIPSGDADAVYTVAALPLKGAVLGDTLVSIPSKPVAPKIAVEELLDWRPVTTGLTSPITWSMAGTLVPGLVVSSNGLAGFATRAGMFAGVILRATGANGVVQNFLRDLYVSPGKVGQYFFANDRGRPATQPGSVTAAKAYTRHTSNFYSPPYKSNSALLPFPGHYTRADGGLPSEIDLPNSYTVEAFALHAWVGGAWIKVQGKIAGSNSAVINPGTGLMSDPVVFPQDLPANTPMRCICALQAPSGGVVPTSFPNRNSADPITGASEGALGHATTSFASTVLDDNPPISGQNGVGDGRMSGLYAPEFIVMKAVEGIDRPVVWGVGDSIAWGKNGLENQLMGKYGDFGFLSFGLSDDTRSRRIMHYNCCVPGVGGTEWTDRTKWDGKLDLIRMVPNRPYTRVITEHNNNGGLLSTDADYGTTGRAQVHAYLATLASEGTYWGDAAPPIYATRPLPRPGAWPYNLTVQNAQSSTVGAPYPTSAKWQYDADLVAGNVFTELAGVIDIARDYQADQGSNRDKIKVPAYNSVLTADTTATVNILVQAPCAIGEYLLINPGQANQQGRHVVGVSGSSAPYTIQLDSNMTAGVPAGSPVQSILAGDSQGLHPATPGHKLIANGLIDWKIATFG